MVTREDGVLIVVQSDGTIITEHADGTRITTFYRDIEGAGTQGYFSGNLTSTKLVSVSLNYVTRCIVILRPQNYRAVIVLLFHSHATWPRDLRGTYLTWPLSLPFS